MPTFQLPKRGEGRKRGKWIGAHVKISEMNMNHGTGTSSAVDPPLKRRRGRPRKDESLAQSESTPSMPGTDSQKKNKQTLVTTGGAIGCDMVGQVVSGVIEGAFDAGYLLKVKVGDTDTHLRGVVFLPGRFTPITTANDVAPQAKMYKRTEMPVPVSYPPVPPPAFDPSSEKSDKQSVEQKLTPVVHEQGIPSKFQSTVPIALANQSAPKLPPPTDNLLLSSMVSPMEGKAIPQKMFGSGLMNQPASAVAQALHDKLTKQDELMQEFEASMRKGPTINVEAASEQAKPAVPSTPSVNLFPGTESLKQDLHQTSGLDLKPNPLVHDLVKTPILERSQSAIMPNPLVHDLVKTPSLERSQSAIIPESGTISSDPIEVNLWMGKQVSSQDAAPQAFALEILSGADTSQLNGTPMAHTSKDAPAKPAPLTSLPTLMFDRDGVPSSTKLPSEGSPLQRMIDQQTSSSSIAADIMKGNPGPALVTNLPTSLFEREALPSESKIPTDGPLLPTMTKPLFCSSTGASNVDCNMKDTIPSTES
ncbi:hypothetical protein Tsubulata_003112 [Turnera subulata]|uniref:Uncharacterized protein n=1 Tax=Turnera subulata TaxID=218843 RepID=A0A9Q0JFF5_9ROSI|nr:hypothetical protein Tsubulata_003112 [Turnera subulata]